MSVTDICCQGSFSDAMFYKWRARFGSMEASEAQHLRDLNAEIFPLQWNTYADKPTVRLGAVLQHGCRLLPPAERMA